MRMCQHEVSLKTGCETRRFEKDSSMYGIRPEIPIYKFVYSTNWANESSGLIGDMCLYELDKRKSYDAIDNHIHGENVTFI